MGATPAKPLGASETKAFLNFMKFFKKEHTDLEKSEIDKCGADTWGKLMPDQKKLFAVKPASAFARRKKKTAPKKPRKPRKNKFIEDSRKPSQRGSKKKNNFKSNRKTSVPAMSSAFLGFMREFRRNNSNMGTLLSLQKGTKEWVKLSKDDQDRYRKEPQHRRSHDAKCSKDDSQTAALSN
ncbi:uncharacterized protein Dana_GF20096 [Drosophila ananassae]|uniref:HMG box domain-containing protein n=1 Tax=Drosophila ananassae TaxID=7217 RepID=B3M769_DROAN|nr:uncharacterized protein LOC6502818 [Drosophila ananassae]EDV38730.2 uncharacterized protein Dana_GF20096 [Drosophila ananassae]